MHFFDQLCTHQTYLVVPDIEIPDQFYTSWKEFEAKTKPHKEEYLIYWESKEPSYDLSNMLRQLITGLCQRRMPNKFLYVVTQYTITHSNLVRDKIMAKNGIKEFDVFLKKRVETLHNVINLQEGNELIKYEELLELFKNNEIGTFIDDAIKKEMFFKAYRFMRAFNYPKTSYYELVEKMPDNSYKLATKVISEMNLDIHKFEKIKNKITYEALNYMIYSKQLPWEKMEELLAPDKIKLEFYVKGMLKRLPNQMQSIAKRNNIDIKEQPLTRYYENKLFKADQFGPTEGIIFNKGDSYINLYELGIREESIIMVESENDLTQEIIDEILLASETGLDSESYGEQPQTKFSNRLQLCLLQIALPHKIYLLNTQELKKYQKYKDFLKSYLLNQNKKIGQGLNQDISLILGDINKNIEPNGTIELMTLFKAKFPNESRSNLALQCKKLLNKELSKIEQISHWHRRPLRKAQIHYAALDAYICLYLYQNCYK